MKKFLISFASLCALCAPFSASAARLYIDPMTGSHGLGDTFITSVRIDNEKECINAAEADVLYPTKTLRAIDFGRGSSIFTLWVEEPTIDAEKGVIHFAGGVPGGYCGRITGDPALTNIIGKIAFTVVGADVKKAEVSFSPASRVYLNDGQGTVANTSLGSATFDISPKALAADNPWLQEVAADTIPPDPFEIGIESTRGVFGGNYYLIFSTVDKQSGLDHFDMYDRGGWKKVTSPFEVKGPIIREAIEIKAVDKAGNERFGILASTTPARQVSIGDYPLLWAALLALFILGLILWHRDRRQAAPDQNGVPLQS